MPKFTTNTHRFDPYKNFKFKVYWEGNTSPVAGISKVSALKKMTEVVEHREGGGGPAGKSPGRTKYEPVTLERGVTHDVEFEQWANKVWNYGSAGSQAEVSLKDFRRNVIIEVQNEAGQPVLRYTVYRCWVSEFQATSEFDANANAVCIQTIKLENEGWERDYSLAEPKEPSFVEPA